MRIPFLRTTLAISLAAASTYTLANGLAINEQSASGAGTAYAGRASSALDASTIYGNPAGLSKLKGTQVSGGLAVIHANVDISSPNKNGTNKGDMVPFAAVPFGYFSSQIDDNWAYGLGIYVPFGVVSDYENGFAGEAHGLKSSVRVVTVQPTISYKFNDRVAIGFGPTINRIDGELSSRLHPQLMMGDTSLSAFGTPKVKVKGDDMGYGFNFGAMIDLSDATTWGITYHSKVKYKLDGHITISNAVPELAALGVENGKYKGKLDFTSPESIDTSISHKIDDQWTVHAGATWTRWSRLDSLQPTSNTAPSAVVEGSREELKWKDTWSFSLGTSYQVNPELVLRAGLAFDPSPTDDKHRNVRIPVSDRGILGLGLGWKASENLTVDAAYAYIREKEGKIQREASRVAGPFPGTEIETRPSYSAKYKNSAHGLTASATYRF